jgi:hypothetical protein
MRNVTFADVVFNNPGKKPFGPDYHCKHVIGTATGLTWPVPECMEDKTVHRNKAKEIDENDKLFLEN